MKYLNRPMDDAINKPPISPCLVGNSFVNIAPPIYADITPINDNIKHYALSNKIIYDYIFAHTDNQNNIKIIRDYLNAEYNHYETLKNSEFFIKL